MLLAGNPDDKAPEEKPKESGPRFFNIGNFGWSVGAVPEDTPAKDAFGKEKILLQGTIVRVYSGKIPWKATQTLTVPNAAGEYLIEPAGGGFWLAYDETPEAKALMSSPAYVAAVPNLRKRTLSAKLSPKDLIPLKGGPGAEDAANAMGLYSPELYVVDFSGFPVFGPDGKPQRKDGGGGGGSTPPPAKKPSDNTGLLALLGIGVLALLSSKE